MLRIGTGKIYKVKHLSRKASPVVLLHLDVFTLGSLSLKSFLMNMLLLLEISQASD